MMSIILLCKRLALRGTRLFLFGSLATHLLLLMFELLAADNLESHRHYWILVFVPLVREGASVYFKSAM